MSPEYQLNTEKVNTEKRKIIQIQVLPKNPVETEEDEGDRFYALCNDGTIWNLDYSGWEPEWRLIKAKLPQN